MNAIARFTGFACTILFIHSYKCVDCHVDALLATPLSGSEISSQDSSKARFVANLRSSTRILKTIGSQEKIQYSGTKYLMKVNDSVDLWQVPVERMVVVRYILTMSVKGSVDSFVSIHADLLNQNEQGFLKKYRFLSSPFCFLKDIDLDGIQEVFIKTRGHNGTVYNATVWRIFSYKNHLFRELGSFENLAVLPLEDKFLVRHWDWEGNRIGVYKKDLVTSTDSVMVGSFEIDVYNNALRISNRKVNIPLYSRLLVTINGE